MKIQLKKLGSKHVFKLEVQLGLCVGPAGQWGTLSMGRAPHKELSHIFGTESFVQCDGHQLPSSVQAVLAVWNHHIELLILSFCAEMVSIIEQILSMLTLQWSMRAPSTQVSSPHQGSWSCVCLLLVSLLMNLLTEDKFSMVQPLPWPLGPEICGRWSDIW